MNAQLKQIFWNLVNSALAGALVLLGALTDGNITQQGFLIALTAAGLVAVNQFKDFWKTEEAEYCNKTKLGVFFPII